MSAQGAGAPRVLFLTQYFPPESGAPQIRLLEFAQRLQAAGFGVQVLTAMPNYPHGRIFPAYRGRWVVRETLGDVAVVRTGIYPSQSVAFLPRMLNYFSFVLTSALIGPFLVRRPDVIFVQSGPLFLGISGVFLKWLMRARMILNISDLWPETAITMGVVKSRRVIAFARWLERTLYRLSDACAAPTRGVAEGVRRVHPGARVEMIVNGCDTRKFSPGARSVEFRRSLNAEDKVLVGYAGLLGLAQGVDVIIRVAERLADVVGVHFVIVGDGAERAMIAEQLRAKKLANVTLHDHVPPARMPGIVAAFDLTIIPLRYSLPGSLPSKTYEAMASAVPIVMAAADDSAALIRESQAGVVVPYDDIDAIAAAVRGLAGDAQARARLGGNGRRHVEKYHDRGVVAARLAALVTDLAGRSPASGQASS